MSVRLTSRQNARVKQVIKLNNRRQRDELKLTVVEGVREATRALQAGVVPVEAFICPELVANDATAVTAVTRLHHLAQTHTTQIYEVTPEVFARLAYRGESGGLLLTIPYFARPLAAMPLTPSPLLVVVAGGEKPGNIGAILRTADAAGINGLILSTSPGETGTDLHNPNVLRASLGAAFTIPVAMATDEETISWLHTNGISIVIATPQAECVYTAVNLTDPVAIILGSEAHGLNPTWLQAAQHKVTIPMHGIVDSLNLSVSAALLMYEAVRQRQYPNHR